MTYAEFIQQNPDLHGSAMKNGKQYIGTYAHAFNKWSNSFCYFFVGKGGRLNKNMGISINRAFALLQNGNLSTDPEKGNIKNYI